MFSIVDLQPSHSQFLLTMGGSESKESEPSPTIKRLESLKNSFSRFGTFCASVSNEEGFVDARAFTQGLPDEFQPFGDSIFVLIGDTKLQGRDPARLTGDELDHQLRILDKKGIDRALLVDTLPLWRILNVCLGHELNLKVETRTSIADMFPNLASMFTDKVLAKLATEQQPASPLSASSHATPGHTPRGRLIAPWHLELVSMLSSVPIRTPFRPKLLFSNEDHGKSLSQLVHRCKEYAAAFTVIMRDQHNRVFGVLLPHGFKETVTMSKEGFDQSETGVVLFQLLPEVRVRRWSGRESARNFFYLNLTHQHHVKGMGFGGQEGGFRLSIDEDLVMVKSTGLDATFSAGQLLSVLFDLQVESEDLVVTQLAGIELYGLGGEEAYGNFLRRKQDLEEIRHERKKVDKARFVENDFDKEMFFDKSFPKHEQI